MKTCVTNKPIKFLENFNYKLCAVGKNNFSKKYLRCDTGNNIYNKEKHYSELTFHYWYWKNKLDINNENWIIPISCCIKSFTFARSSIVK